MKKAMVSLIVLVYIMQISFLINTFYGSTSDWPTYFWLGSIIAFLILSIINFLVALKNRNKMNETVYKKTMIFKLILIPFYIINFIVGLILLMGGLIFLMALLPMLFMVILIIIFTYIIMLSTSIYSIIQMFKDRKKYDEIVIWLNILAHLIFIVDLISSIWIYIYSSKSKASNGIIETDYNDI